MKPNQMIQNEKKKHKTLNLFYLTLNKKHKKNNKTKKTSKNKNKT